MSLQIQADPVKQRAIAGNVGKCYSALSACLQAAQADVAKLKGVWTGDAADAYRAAFAAIYARCEESMRTVSGLSKSLYESADAYEKGQATVKQKAEGVRKLKGSNFK